VDPRGSAARDEIVKRYVSAAQQGVKGELDGDVTGSNRKRITAREDRRTRSAAIESGVRKGQRGESERGRVKGGESPCRLVNWRNGPEKRGLRRGQKADGGRQC